MRDDILKVSAYIESHGGPAPSALCVVLGMCGGAYRQKNDVFVTPITSLKP